MNQEAIFHQTYSEYCFALSQNHVVLRLRAGKGDLSDCRVFYGDRMDCKNPVRTTEVVMKKKYSDSLFDYFETDIYPKITRLCYYFLLSDGKQNLYYYNNCFFKEPNENRQLYFQLHYIRKENIAQVPDWAAKAIIYQIYPDSFASGRREIVRKDKTICESDGFVSRSKFGGTLCGIIENIDYLKNLGISCLYLNPIFRANSWHKYDTIDYRSIDPCFGTEEDFKRLVDTCHQNGIRVMLDAVFNHCSPDFFAFRDVLEKEKNSRYREWFYISDFPIVKKPVPNYECFAYVGNMPKLNTGNPEVKQYLIDTACYWTKNFNVDAWRLDVANEIDFDFWRHFRQALKTIDPDVFIVGEIWDDARAFLQGEQMDSVMNYNLYYACLDFFAKEELTAKAFNERINYLLIRYKRSIQQAQMNLLDSHDVPRFLTSAGGDIRKLKLAALFLLTHIGVPSIYYGDEKGLNGWEEIDYRQPMDWERPEGELFKYYQRLIALRTNNMDAMLGDFETIQADGGLYIYRRKSETTCLIVAINNAETSCEVSFAVSAEDGSYTDPINKHPILVQGGLAHLTLSGYDAAVMVEKGTAF
ncbi:MAG TPA: glycoside hydrolase family 13 protein [Caproiciproducens sp.]|nr:glycoside hydrolase family 13 protein [Caproiciproducens sp.]